MLRQPGPRHPPAHVFPMRRDMASAHALTRLSVICALAVAVGSCQSSGDEGPAAAPAVVETPANTAKALEWVGFHSEVPMAGGDVHALIAGLVGADAQAGKLVVDREVTPK